MQTKEKENTFFIQNEESKEIQMLSVAKANRVFGFHSVLHNNHFGFFFSSQVVSGSVDYDEMLCPQERKKALHFIWINWKYEIRSWQN